MIAEEYKRFRITADIHNRLENHCAVRWEVMRPVQNGWEGIEAFVDNIEYEISDDDALAYGIRQARKYVDEKL